MEKNIGVYEIHIFHWFRKVGKKMTVDITWAKDKSDITTRDTQTKTFNSEEQAIEWIRRNAKHIVSINHRGFFISEQISHFDIMDCLMNGY